MTKKDFCFGSVAKRALGATHRGALTRPLPLVEQIITGHRLGIDVEPLREAFERQARAEAHRLEAALRREKRAAARSA